MELVLIAGVAANGVIGRNGTLPWHFPDDLAHFKGTTMGHPVIMGRVNFEDVLEHLGGPLPGRTNIVLSRSEPDLPDDVILARDIDQAIEAAEATGSDVAYVAGGARVYEQFFPMVDRLVLTELHTAYEGDTTFPEWDRNDWIEVERKEYDDFDIVVYTRVVDG